MKTDYTFFDKDTTIQGELKTTSLILEGRFEGKINAQKKILLKKTARINADIRTKKLAVEEGAVYNGKITLTAKDDKDE